MRSASVSFRVPAYTERTFVIRDQNGRAEWVDVKKGATENDLIEVTGDLRPGDRIVARNGRTT